jgi:hypothetical protein
MSLRTFSANLQAMLPPLVSAYLSRALPDERPAPRQVRITQEGRMWFKPGASPRRFTAVQHLAVDRVAFAWRARFPIVPWVAINVFDGYADGAGRLEVKMLGRTIQREQGPEVRRGEALRYLAELPLVPYAMVGNAELEWHELDERRVELSARAGPDPVAVTVEFDAAGDIVRTSTPGRAYRRGDAWVPTPWAGVFSDYRELGGMRVPTCAEVSWELDGARFVYWSGRIISAVALDAPFGSERP